MRKEIRRTLADEQQRLITDIPVIAGTPVGLFNGLPKEHCAAVVILDEAGQCPEPLTWLAASFGKRLVLCGDPQQLPPTVFSPEARQLGLGVSLLERLMAERPAIVLREQYRMTTPIAGAINGYFYNDALITIRKEAGLLEFIDMAGYGEGESTDDYSGSTFHTDEAHVVEKVVRNAGLSPANTVILSPYNAQLGILQTLLPEFRISTIDAIQGQEADTVIISLTRSNTEQRIGFLKDYRRTNVAITRARFNCVLVGDSATLGSDPFYNHLITHIEQNGGYRSAWEFAG